MKREENIFFELLSKRKPFTKHRTQNQNERRTATSNLGTHKGSQADSSAPKSLMVFPAQGVTSSQSVMQSDMFERQKIRNLAESSY